MKVRVYVLSCGTEWRNTEVWPKGTQVHCPAHPSTMHQIVKKLRAVEEAAPATPGPCLAAWPDGYLDCSLPDGHRGSHIDRLGGKWELDFADGAE